METPGGQIFNQHKRCHLEAKFVNNTSGATWWPIMQPVQMALPDFTTKSDLPAVLTVLFIINSIVIAVASTDL